MTATMTAYGTITVITILTLLAGPVAAFLHALGLQGLQRGVPECSLPTVKQGWGGREQRDDAKAELYEFRSRAQPRWLKCII